MRCNKVKKNRGKESTKTGNKGRTGSKRASKLFIGGLPPVCTEGDLWNYFSNLDSLKRIDIKISPNGVGKGFAFINIEDPDEVHEILAQEHRIFGKLFSIKSLTTWKDRELAKRTENEKKFYIGGLAKRLSELDVERYFR